VGNVIPLHEGFSHSAEGVEHAEVLIRLGLEGLFVGTRGDLRNLLGELGDAELETGEEKVGSLADGSKLEESLLGLAVTQGSAGGTGATLGWYAEPRWGSSAGVCVFGPDWEECEEWELSAIYPAQTGRMIWTIAVHTLSETSLGKGGSPAADSRLGFGSSPEMNLVLFLWLLVVAVFFFPSPRA
jgi:hypothetical protein